ncbi:hypothetical protein DQ04_02141080 [Trypanosoma grayi]|uniref:hypothetical protein n=1 Tax=Trypanosoma grayi TaxID=71804 RepID=UPI0004F4BDC7|nr:hypothetical protein DQ04_02141080 [Trypanosoma grayi]KEG11930.1 hypothetical protein DQ04_02141080 [Trypanosoma grayi]
MPLFLSTQKWHRLDNVGAISTIAIICLHLSCFDSDALVEILKYFFLFSVIILQEADPWNIFYTAVPISFAALMVAVSHYVHSQKRRRLIRKNFCIGFVLCVLGIMCFTRGLDVPADPFGIWHGLFHVFVGLGLYEMLMGLRQRGKTNYVERMKPASEGFDV